MTSYSDASIVRLPSLSDNIAEDARRDGPETIPNPSFDDRRSSPSSAATLTVLALAAGIGALALGALALVIAATSRGEGRSTPVVSQAPPRLSANTAVERKALALLAKPSTARIAFRGSGGTLVLAVGSGGRGAILIRGLERAPSGRPYHAWIVGDGTAVRVARFTGAERAVFLSAPVAKGTTVAVATERASALRSGSGRMAAIRG